VGFLRRLFGEEDAADQARHDAEEQGQPVDTGGFGPPGIPGLTGDTWGPAEVDVDDDDPTQTVVRFPAPDVDPDSLTVERDEGKVTVSANGKSDGPDDLKFVEVLDLPPEIDAARVTVDAEPDTIVIRIPKS